MKVELLEVSRRRNVFLSIPVCETSWADVFDAGIGGLRAQNDREEPRIPSAYLLVYINADQKLVANGQHELPADLQRVLDDDLVLLQQQSENIKLEQLHSDFKSACERIEKQQPAHRALSIPFFTGPNAPSGTYFSLKFSAI